MILKMTVHRRDAERAEEDAEISPQMKRMDTDKTKFIVV